MPATPAVGWICAEQTCISVVLPAPLGPRITQRSSSSTDQSIASSSVAWPRRTVTSASSRTAAIGHLGGRYGRRTFRGDAGAGPNLPNPGPRPSDRYIAPVSAPLLPVSAILSTWLGGVLAGRAQLDGPADVAAMRRPASTWSSAWTRIRSRSCSRSACLRRRGGSGCSLALPAPGDPLGLAGPPAFNARGARGRSGRGGHGAGLGLVPEPTPARDRVGGPTKRRRRRRPTSHRGRLGPAHASWRRPRNGSSTSTSPAGSPRSPTC